VLIRRGPLFESLPATFKRLKETFDIDLPATKDNLAALQSGIGIDSKIRNLVMEFLSTDRLNYNKTLGDVDKMLDEILSSEWREKYMDDFGNPYTFTWFVMDHIGFTINPRRRMMGYSVLFDYYLDKLTEHNCQLDELAFHYHPVSYSREAHRASNNLSFTNEHHKILSYRVIEYNWFPSSFRPGLHSERPDLNWFLEMWIPFDYGNQAIDPQSDDKKQFQRDLGFGRWGDWRRATYEWEIYQPSLYDYQKQGEMNRYIARCLNLNARINSIDEFEIEKAFLRAENGKPTILAFTNHDEREMRPYSDWLYNQIRFFKNKYPEVKIRNSTASLAMQEVLGLEKENKLEIDYCFEENTLHIKTNQSCWGPQPYFCFKTKMKDYIWDNLDFQSGNHWTYVFDDDTLNLNQIEKIGIASNNKHGNSSVKVIEV
jgi:hypothetical protein